ncbi:MAG: nucleoside triphosphate pyrophosphohydrolase [Kiritimatiellae bacterium]|nr:nucleoside triphosphate pyrophosphohydrolase [Kiritimatiellia bacterium]
MLEPESQPPPTHIERLLDIMRRLRGPDGCPWDREQTLETLKTYLLEECYEVLDAIDGGDPEHHKEELGDLLLQIVFQSQIRAEQQAFSFDEVAERICRKLVHRHPHVFGDVHVSDSGEVLRNWQALKAKEKEKAPAGVLGEVPRHMPALHKAHKIQARAARVGFDWTAVHDVVAKIDEELAEVKEALGSGDRDRLREEIGDLLFAVVNLSRFQKIDAEEVLAQTVEKFTRRFREVERRIHKSGRQLTDCTLAEMDAHWDAVKGEEE